MAEAKQAPRKATPPTRALAKITDQEMQNKAREKQLVPIPVEFKALEIVRHRIREIREFIARGLLEKGIDYGRIPGVNKDMLFKAGCEMLLLNYGIVVDPPDIEDRSDFEKGIFRYRIILKGYEKDTRTYVGMGVASCSSYETKYRYRWLSSYKLPDSMRTLGYNHEVGKFDPETLKKVWIAEKGDQAFRFQTSDKGSYPQWRTENQDTWDLENTILKQATTRALRALTLNVTGADRLFINEKDLEELGMSDLDDTDFVEGEYKEVAPETGEIKTSETATPTTPPTASQPPKTTNPIPTRSETGGEPAPAPSPLSSPTTQKPEQHPCPKHSGQEFIKYPTKAGGTVMAHKDGVDGAGKTVWCFEDKVLEEQKTVPVPPAPRQGSLLEPNDMDAVDVHNNDEFLRVLSELCSKLKYGGAELGKFLETNYPTSGANPGTLPIAVRRPLLKDLYALVKPEWK
jgi:hypothetical protein